MAFKVEATIRMYSTEEGGRKGATGSTQYGCLIWFGEAPYHDVRLMLEGVGKLSPGKTYAGIPLDFLHRDLVEPYLLIGQEFQLREDRDIGSGTITLVEL